MVYLLKTMGIVKDMGVKEKHLFESVLFSASKLVSISEINEAINLSRIQIKTTLEELIEDYNITRKKYKIMLLLIRIV